MSGAFPLSVNVCLPPQAQSHDRSVFWQDISAEQQQALAPWQAFITGIAASSPYLDTVMRNEQDFLLLCLEQGADRQLQAVMREIAELIACSSQDGLMHGLRRSKARAALLIALADIGGLWAFAGVVEALTAIADALVKVTVDWLLLDADRGGRLRLKDQAQPSPGCGYVVLAMGKQGAHELNYSSDVDLIILYDPDIAPLDPAQEPAIFFVRFTRKLVQCLQEITEDGYALRVDLRLRPDPRATQVAIAIEAAAVYYESMGQNWERAAMIKARPVAGDIALGDEFIQRLKPYVWRKYLDFAAIADVQSLKRQIHAVKGHGEIAVHGHNVKLGRGGIREIEFFVQTQQLIAGGRNPTLRGRRTLDMLQALAESGWISAEAASSLSQAYVFLRTIEHRLQMVNDEQTQLLPRDEDGFARFAWFSGYGDVSGFEARLRSTFEMVQEHYAALFESAEGLGHEAGDLVFTGGDDDPGTIETLKGLGYRQSSEVSATVRGWHFSRYAATRSARAREALTELMPALLVALSRGGDPDQAFMAFDRFLSRLPAGVQLFAMLQANPRMLDLIAMILGAAPRLSEQVAARPAVLDAVLDPGFFGPLPGAAGISALVGAALPDPLPLDELADRARLIGREQMFRVGVRVLSDTVSAEEAGLAYAELAAALIARLHRAITADMEERHGRLPQGSSCVIGMGKLGGREMTASSDLDLMLVYDVADSAAYSDGPKPLSTSQYYARLTQRLINALSSPTAEGVLYEVDMRLRPSGNKGPVATSLGSFIDYQKHSAWTWEKLALTRARPVAGDDILCRRMADEISRVLREARQAETVRADVLSMRRLMLQEKADGGVWDIKQGRGGLAELEFIAQYLQILKAHDHPHVLSPNTYESLRRLAEEGLLSRKHADQLKEACLLYQRLTQLLRLALGSDFDPDQAPAGLRRLVAQAAALPDLKAVESLLSDRRAVVASAFDVVVGVP